MNFGSLATIRKWGRYMKLTAQARRSQGWWAVRVPELDGLFTQARRLDQVEMMVKDAAALLTEQPEDTFEVTVVPQLDTVEQRLLKNVSDTRKASDRLAKGLQELSKEAVDTLAAQELSYRDIGELIGVSYQRVAQIHSTGQDKLKQAS